MGGPVGAVGTGTAAAAGGDGAIGGRLGETSGNRAALGDSGRMVEPSREESIVVSWLSSSVNLVFLVAGAEGGLSTEDGESPTEPDGTGM